MADLQAEKNKRPEEIKAALPDYEEKQKASWDVLEGFDKTTGVNTALGVKYAEYDSMDLSQLRDALFKDEDKKTKSFQTMYDSVNELLNLSVSKGRYFDENGNGMTRDFFEALFTAVSGVNQYLATHTGYRWQTKGERRVQIATRISILLKELTGEIERVQSELPEKKARMVDYAREGLTEEEIVEREKLLRIDNASAEVLRIAETGEFGPKTDEKKDKEAANKWIVSGYTDELRNLIKDGDVVEDTRESRNDFLAFLTDQNNRLLANRMAISIMMEDAGKVTLGMPWLKEELKAFLLKNISDEQMLTKTADFADIVRNSIENFRKDNSGRIAALEARRDRLTDVLRIPEGSADLYDHPMIKDLLTVPDDKVFGERLETVRTKVAASDRLISDYMKEHFSEATRSHITQKLVRFIGAFRVTASPEQVMDQLGVFCDMLKYTAPEAFIIEKSITNMMKDLAVDSVRRDHFVAYLTDNRPTRLLAVPIELLRAKAEKYADNVKANSRSFAKRADAKGRYLSAKQWDEIEKLNLESGGTKNSEFKDKLEAVMSGVTNDTKLSRNEYLTGREYRDAQKEPERIRRAQLEKDLIEKMGDGMDKKLLLQLAGDGENPYADFRRLDAVYKGTNDELNMRLGDEERLAAERAEYLNRALQKGGVPKKLWPAYLKKFRHLMGSIREVSRDMTDDVRLHIERVNLERFGVRTIDDALEKIAELGPELAEGKLRADGTVEDNAVMTGVKERYASACDVFRKYDGGKYAEFTDFLVSIPEVFKAMMSSSGEDLEKYIAENIDGRLGSFLEGVNLAGKQRSAGEKGGDRSVIPSAVRKQYAYSYIRSIYDGRLKGDAEFFRNQLEGYNDKVFRIKSDGLSSIADNIRAAEKMLDRELRKKRRSDLPPMNIKIAVLAKLYEMSNDTVSFVKLMDRDTVVDIAKSELTAVTNSVKEKAFSDEVKNSIVREFTDELPVTAEETAKKKTGIKKKKTEGAAARYAYLRVDVPLIEDIRRGKSLVRVAEKGRRRIKLNTSMADDMRGRIQKYCSAYELPPALYDALVEEGSSEAFTDRVTGIMWSNDKLQKHAFAMYKLNSFLTKDFKDDRAMSDEEAQMYIISLYGNPDKRELFEKEGGPDVSALRAGRDYKLFRQDYEKLVRLETGVSGDESLERERVEMSKNLRTMLVTGLGTLDIDGKPFNNDLLITDGEKSAHLETLGEIIDRNNRYLEQSAKLSEIIHRQIGIEEKDKGFRYSEHFKNMKTIAIRDYFMADLVRSLRSKRGFSEKVWTERVAKVYSDKDIWENLVFDRDSVSDDKYTKAEKRRIETAVNETNIAETIRASTILFKGRVNKYESLDEDQKKIFALGLILMDKGAIGYGARGSIDLINAHSVRADKYENARRALNGYVRGQGLNIDIDYREALNKLVNYGETNFFYKEGYAFSETAYEKALQFVSVLTAKKIASMDKDLDRLNYGYDSINTAYVKYGKENQFHETEKLRDESLTIEDVRDKLLEYVDTDMMSVKEIGKTALKEIYKSPLGIAALDREAARRMKMNRLKERLQKMSHADLRLFVRIMQDRGVLDESRAGADLFVEQKKRNALCEALSSDAETRTSVLAGFDDSESCSRVLVNALSFQLRDDVDFRNKDLTQDHFDNASLNRDTLADWDLVERAFATMDEIRERRASIYALSHASDYILQSGNLKAMEENKKLESSYKNKEDFTRDHFEKYIKQQADKDGETDVKRAVAGYHALSDGEKALFFTALSRRDLLDISRKDYKKSFFGIKDRNYVNQSGRDKLIDRYINSSLEGNVGITVRPGIHYDALKMLFSTQISDREGFDTDKSIESMTVVERNLFMGRATAIDWKLFKRALNFVYRASEELEYAEGNAQLYKGAGDLVSGGKMDMNYSFLRKNFHRTGNRWGRYIGRMFVRSAQSQAGFDVLETIADGVEVVDKSAGYLFGLRKDGFIRKGLSWVKNTAEDYSKNEAALKQENGAEFNVSSLKTKYTDPAVANPAIEKERRENLTYFQHIYEGIDTVFSQGKTVTESLEEARILLRDSFAAPAAKQFEFLKPLTATGAKQADADEKNIVQAATSGKEKDSSYGDVRDKAVSVIDTGKEAVDLWNRLDGNPGTKEITKLIRYTTQRAVYGFINDKLMKKKIELKLPEGTSEAKRKEEERKQLVKAADEYASNVFRSLMRSTVGEENANKLLSLEKSLYAVKKPMTDMIRSAVDGISYAQKCVHHVENISSCLQNRSILTGNAKAAGSMRDKDNEKLRRAGENRLSEEQAEKAGGIVNKHRGMAFLGDEIATAVQDFNIAAETVNFAVETATVAGGRLNVGQAVIARAVKEGLQFALFALRVASDRSSLADYYLHTEAGKAVVGKVKEGFIKSGDQERADEIDRAADRQKSMGVSSLVDIISDARGYEHTSELVENTAMSMAQSIVFCASSYNPMAETKLMAITVMSVMGLSDEIGSTSPETVEKLFNSFRVSG